MKQTTRYVPTKFRIHKLSFIPGGTTVSVTDIFGKTTVYDKVHYAAEYIAQVLLECKELDSISVDGKLFWSKLHGAAPTMRLVPKERKLIPIGRRAA